MFKYELFIDVNCMEGGDSGNLSPMYEWVDANLVPNMEQPELGYAIYDADGGYGGASAIVVDLTSVSGSAGAVDGNWVGVERGGHYRFECWVKTSSYSSSDACGGVQVGFDFYGSCYVTGEYGVVESYGILGNDVVGDQLGHPHGAETNPYSPFGYTINGENGLSQVGGLVCRVGFGHDWTKVSYDFLVPEGEYYAWNEHVGVPVHISDVVFWFQVNNMELPSTVVWFSSPSLIHVSSDVLPTPVPTPTADPEATPTPVPTYYPLIHVLPLSVDGSVGIGDGVGVVALLTVVTSLMGSLVKVKRS